MSRTLKQPGYRIIMGSALALAAVCTLAACNQETNSRAPEGAGLGARARMASDGMAAKAIEEAAFSEPVDVAGIMVPAGPRPVPDQIAPAPDTSERKLIRNANLTIKVESVDDAILRIIALADSLDGYTTSQNQSTNPGMAREGNVEVKIPAERLDEMLNTASALGEILFQNIWSQDVTDQYYDVEVHLNNARQERDQLSALLGRAERLEDILRVRRELNRVTSEYETLKGRMQRLSNQIRYSTVHIHLTETLPTTQDTDTVLGQIAQAFRDMVDIFWATLAGVIRFIGFAVPVGVIVAILFRVLMWLVRRRRNR